MQKINASKLHKLYRRMKYRNWIRRQLQQAGGADYLRQLETDIGAAPGHFRRELEETLISGERAEKGADATGVKLRLPSMPMSLIKT